MSNSKKVFLLFGGVEHYAGGGFNDYLSSHETAEDAIKCAATMVMDSVDDPGVPDEAIDWWHVFDVNALLVVARSEHQAYGGARPNEPIPLQGNC